PPPPATPKPRSPRASGAARRKAAREAIAEDRAAEAAGVERSGDPAEAVDHRAAQTVYVPKPAGGWDGGRLYAAAETACGPKPTIDQLHQLIICRKCEGLSRPHGRPTRCAGIRCGSHDVIGYRAYGDELDARNNAADGL